MVSTSFARLCAGAVLTLCSVSLLTWALFWHPLSVLHPPQWAYLPPLSACLIGLTALGLLASCRPGAAGVWWCLGTVALLCIVIFVEHLLVLPGGIEWLLFYEAVNTLLQAEHPGRPALLVAVCLLLSCGAIALATLPRQGRFDAADVCAVGVLVPAFTLVLGYLFQARILVDASAARFEGGAYLPEMLLLGTLALGALSLNPQGVIATWRDEGSAAKRRLMPAAILIPVLLGLVLSLALQGDVIDPTLAVSLAVVAGILVSIVLLEWVSGLLAERAAVLEGELLQRESKAREEGMTDALTGLLNRRGWDHYLRQVEERYQRDGGNACVVVIDLDGLKRINDTEGHAAGDALIRRAGRALESASRREDVVARLGGDEFTYLAVDCQPQHAELVLRRLSAAFEKAGVQASLGYAMRDLAGSLPQAFHEADEAMYAHKRSRKAQARSA